jgi:hypothetical protein
LGERGGGGDVSGAFAVVLALAEFGGAAAGLAGEHAGEVVAVGEAVFDGDLVDGFVGESEGFGGEAEAGGEDVGGGGLADVVAEGADEGLEGEAGAFGEEVVGEACVGGAGDEGEDVDEGLGEGGWVGGFEVGEDEVEEGGAEVEEGVVAGIGGRLLVGFDEAGEEGEEGRGDAEGDGMCRNGHSGTGGGEVQPEVGGGSRGAAVEDGVGGDEDSGVGAEGDFLVLELDVTAWGGIEVESPEGAIDTFVVPVLQGVEVAAVVDDEGGPTGGGGAGEVDTEVGGVVEVFGARVHDQTQIFRETAQGVSV